MNDKDMLKAFSGFCFGFLGVITIISLVIIGIVEVFS